MELWIRSQEKEKLIRPTSLYIEETIDYGNECKTFDIYALNCTNDDIKIGTYKTKERALEILDEIQMLLQPMYKVTNEIKKSELTGNLNWIENQEYIPIQSKVYEMQKE